MDLANAANLYLRTHEEFAELNGVFEDRKDDPEYRNHLHELNCQLMGMSQIFDAIGFSFDDIMEAADLEKVGGIYYA